MDGAPLALAAPRQGEMLVEKVSLDAFQSTALASYLHAHGVQRVYLAGFGTAGSILFTAQSAFAHGFATIVIEDACADSVPALHHQTLATYGGRLFSTTTVAELVCMHDRVPQLPVTNRYTYSASLINDCSKQLSAN
jgi:nicotinamidase-related amidase